MFKSNAAKIFQYHTSLISLIDTLLLLGERPYKCNVCDKAFNQKGALQVHMSKHTGDRPFFCDFCPMTFAQRGNLRAHIKVTHFI